ncbi:MAG: hypothetical protein ACI89X_001331 [Planctomycetota bacterium]|jgi:hypothetical protein
MLPGVGSGCSSALGHPSNPRRPPCDDRHRRRWFLAILILANVFAVVIETVSDVAKEWGRLLNDFETFSLTVFGAEYVLRMH